MNTFCKNSIGLLLAFLLWLFLPHFTKGIPCVVLLVVLTVLSVRFFGKSKDHNSTWNLTKQQVIKLNRICHALPIIACFSLAILAPCLFGFPKYRRNIFAVFFVIYSTVWFFVVCCDIATSNSEHYAVFNRVKLSGLAGLPVCFASMFMFRTVLFGLEFSFRVLAIIISLSVILVSYIYYQLSRMKQDQIDYITIWGLLISFMLFFVINSGLDSTETLVRYQLKPGTSETCIIENGRTFSFKDCPISEGTYGWINDHQGWFNVRYVTRLYEE